MLENETEMVFYSVKIDHVLTHTGGILHFIVICMLPSWAIESGRRRQARRVFECEKQETSSACQRPSCKRVSARLTLANTCI